MKLKYWIGLFAIAAVLLAPAPSWAQPNRAEEGNSEASGEDPPAGEQGKDNFADAEIDETTLSCVFVLDPPGNGNTTPAFDRYLTCMANGGSVLDITYVSPQVDPKTGLLSPRAWIYERDDGQEIACLGRVETDPDIQYTYVYLDRTDLFGRIGKFQTVILPRGFSNPSGGVVHVIINDQEHSFTTSLSDTVTSLNSKLRGLLIQSGAGFFESDDYFVIDQDADGDPIFSLGFRSQDPGIIGSEILLAVPDENGDMTCGYQGDV